uniref:HMG box domain-containing protein n=1 Tax=Zea mays TaxID=4577 RepID=A0A804MQI8_MAIZE
MKSRARSGGGDSRLSVRKTKVEKDPNKPKRPPTAFFVFMEEFRKDYKEKHPNVKQVSVIGKAGGDMWKSLSDAEKAPYVSKAEKLKVEYTKKMDAYNNKQVHLEEDPHCLVILTSPSPRSTTGTRRVMSDG